MVQRDMPSGAADDTACERVDAVVIGAGFAGLYMLHRLRELGLSLRGFEAASDVGGVWHWNRYPGARCDVESMQYSYSFSEELQQDWQWTERFARQPEILRYIRHVADRFDLRREIHFDTRVVSAWFDEARALWDIRTDTGGRIEARFCIMATGSLSVAKVPELPGLDSFQGECFHTGDWPDGEVDFGGRRVGIIGTGSSGIQAIPIIAEQAAHLTVFQRTPSFVVPARNRPMDAATERRWKDNYADHRRKARDIGTFYDFSETPALSVPEEERQQQYARRWEEGGVNFVHSFKDLFVDRAANETAAEFVRARIRETVQDPAVAAVLMPKDYPIGTKRICIGSGYYETFNRPNVSLVDLRATPIQEITPTGLRTSAADYPLDTLILATGYDALTGALTRIDLRGRGGRDLRESWAAGPRNYLGLMTSGFPNLFIITGPGSPSVLVNMVVGIEQHVEWIVECLRYLREHDVATMEADPAAEAEWVGHVNQEADKTLFPAANSWYLGANVPGKPRVFMPYVGGIGRYRRICDEVAAKGYEGFLLRRHAAPADATGEMR